MARVDDRDPIPFSAWLAGAARAAWARLAPRRASHPARRPPWGAAGALKSVGWTADEYDRLFGGLDAGMRGQFTHASAVDLADAYAASVWVYAAVTTRAQAVSDAPLVARDADGAPAPAWHRLARLLPARLLWTVEADLCLFGAALLVKQVNAAGVVAGLRRVSPTRFTVDSTEREGLRGFQVQGSPYAYLYPNQVAYLHHYDPNDDFGGVAPAEAALARAGAERAMMEYALSYFANYGVPDTAFMPPENPDPGVDWEREAARLTEALERLFKGVRHRARAAVLPARWSVWQAQAQPDGAAMPALSAEIKQAILTAFGVQESLLFSGASSYAEAESDRLNFNQHTIRPEASFIAGELTEQVVRPHFGDGWRLEPDFSQAPSMQADKAARVTAVSAQVAGGYMTLAEAREATYLPADARLKDYVMVQGTPVHLSRLPELYARLLPPEPGAGVVAGGWGGLANLAGGDGGSPTSLRAASLRQQAARTSSLPVPRLVAPGMAHGPETKALPPVRALPAARKAVAANGGGVSFGFWAPIDADPDRETLRRLRDQAAREIWPGSDIEWVDDAEWHLSLCYAAASVPAEYVAAFFDLPALAERTTFFVTPDRFALWDTPDGPCLVALVEPSEELKRLQAFLHLQFVARDLPVSEHSLPGSYTPHVTLAYGGPLEAGQDGLPALEEPAVLAVGAVELVAGEPVYRWDLRPVPVEGDVAQTLEEAGGAASPFDPGAMRAGLVAWQHAALKGDAHEPASIPAAIAFPLLHRLSQTDSVSAPAIRAAFDPAFVAAKAYRPVDLDRWWEAYAAVEAAAADRLEALWRDMQAEMADALAHLPADADAEIVIAALERVMARYDAAHLAALDPLVEPMFQSGAAVGADQLAALERPAAKTEMQLGILWDLVNQVAVDWARENAAARVTRVTDTTRRQVRDLVAARMAGGLTHEGLIEELGALFDRGRAELIAQTEATLALDGGQETAWRARGVPASRWHTAGDGYVCALCRALNGKVAPLGGTFTLTPAELAGLSAAQRRVAQQGVKGAPVHPGCRCVRVPEQGLSEDDAAVPEALVEAAVRKLAARARVAEEVPEPAPSARLVHDESQVVEHEEILTGVTAPYRLTYADGTQAIWKAARPRSGQVFQDADTDVAASRLGALIYPGLVPETIHGSFRGQEGTVQRFVEDAQVGAEFPGDVTELPRDQVEATLALDLITQNYDRHEYNWLVDSHGSLVAIDNSAGQWTRWDDWSSGRYFAHHSLLSEHEQIRGRFAFSEGTIERLRSITRETFFQALAGLGGRVNAENAWANLQRIVERGEVRW